MLLLSPSATRTLAMLKRNGPKEMIAKLKGRVDTIGDTWMILDVQGVGYLLSCSRQTLGNLPSKGEAAEIHVETVMKAEQLTLYGFATQTEQNCFNLLITVQGVGGRMALSILSVALPNALSQAILAQDATFFTQADGVGPKLANRVVRELKDKVGALNAGDTVGALENVVSIATDQGKDISQEALSALVNLGYKRTEALQAIAEVSHGQESLTLQTVIAQALKKLSQVGGSTNG